MTPAEAAKAIRARWIATWPGLSGGVAYAFDNDVAPEAATFARVSLVSLDAEQYSLGKEGNRKWEHTALVDVRLVGPIDVGREPLDLLIPHIKTIFEGQRIGATPGDGGVLVHAASPAELRRDRESPQSWILSITLPAEYYAVR